MPPRIWRRPPADEGAEGAALPFIVGVAGDEAAQSTAEGKEIMQELPLLTLQRLTSDRIRVYLFSRIRVSLTLDGHFAHLTCFDNDINGQEIYVLNLEARKCVRKIINLA